MSESEFTEDWWCPVHRIHMPQKSHTIRKGLHGPVTTCNAGQLIAIVPDPLEELKNKEMKSDGDDSAA